MRNKTLIPVLIGAAALLLANPFTSGVRADRKDNKNALKQIMRRWSKDLGVKCGYCHVKQGRKFDYEQNTHHKNVALVCADEFVEKLQGEKARPLTCATCHVDKAHEFLPRPEHDERAGADEAKIKADVSAYCQENFVDKLTLKETGTAIGCATCHGDEGEPGRFFPARGEGDEHGEDEHDDDDDDEDDDD